jgi:2,3-bisphosphoglycerate-independent phosphoglycerate mutase
MQANAPLLHKHLNNPKLTTLEASGQAVGLPAGTMGGSEVGHYTMGAGRIVAQSLLRINQDIENRKFYEHPGLNQDLSKLNSDLHLICMISDAGVHSDIKHIQAVLELCKKFPNIQNIHLHAISDGRDVPAKSLQKYLKMVEQYCQEESRLKLSTLIGRFYAMDRDNNQERTKQAYDLIFSPDSNPQKVIQTDNFPESVESQYQNNLDSDYYLKAIASKNYTGVNQEDIFLFLNFRTDRAAQLSNLIVKTHKLFTFGSYCIDATNLFENPVVENNLSQVLEQNQKTQLRIAETEKFAHVTFFFNSQNKDFSGTEQRLKVESKKIANYKDDPAMSAAQVTQNTLKAVTENNPDFVLINYANADLVGHSGDFEATKKAVETLDQELQILIPQLLEHNYCVLITADHGNAEQMQNPDGSICPSHTTNPVPFFIVSQEKHDLIKQGSLADIAPTILDIMQIPKPEQMTGSSLIIK